MRVTILIPVLVSFLAVASLATAHDLGTSRPAKPPRSAPPPAPDPARLRQGGDTILDAVEIAIPTMNLAGTTVGYVNDYDEICPFSGSTSPDVVYTFIVPISNLITIDMIGSNYDTKIYVYDQNLSLVACNDDYYADYTSKIEFLSILAGVQYYLVIDGYGGDAGDYLLSIHENTWWIPQCPPDGQHEDEPPLAVDYVDLWNGGCDADAADPPLQAITQPVFCGVSGWYRAQGVEHRDTDWFTIAIPATGSLEIAAHAWFAMYMFELAPQDCGSVSVVQSVAFGPGIFSATMTIAGAPGETVWCWVGPTTFGAPYGQDVFEYDYLLELSLPVAVESRNWNAVKALFR
jgi:hypothetical protein